MKFEEALKAMREGKLVTSKLAQDGDKNNPFFRLQGGEFQELDKKGLLIDNRIFLTRELLAEDWEIYSPPLKLEDVLPAFREGKKIGRKSWNNKEFGISLMNRKTIVGEFITRGDLMAEDWEIID